MNIGIEDEDRRIDLLLLVLRGKSGIKALQKRGYEYHQIFDLIHQAAEKGFVESDQYGARLTQAGMSRINGLRRNGFNNEPDTWIAPAIDSLIDQMAPDEIYLPQANWRAG